MTNNFQTLNFTPTVDELRTKLLYASTRSFHDFDTQKMDERLPCQSLFDAKKRNENVIKTDRRQGYGKL